MPTSVYSLVVGMGWTWRFLWDRHGLLPLGTPLPVPDGIASIYQADDGRRVMVCAYLNDTRAAVLVEGPEAPCEGSDPYQVVDLTAELALDGLRQVVRFLDPYQTTEETAADEHHAEMLSLFQDHEG